MQIRTNLDLVLDWLQGAGLGDIASEFLKKLSNTVNFLCIPKTRLIQVKVQKQKLSDLTHTTMTFSMKTVWKDHFSVHIRKKY